MSKKNKHNNNNFDNAQQQFPTVVTIDVLANASDSDLRNRENDLSTGRDRAYKSGMDPYHWEVELCYVQREVEIRQSRAAAHERYLLNNPDTVEFDVTVAAQSSKSIN